MWGAFLDAASGHRTPLGGEAIEVSSQHVTPFLFCDGAALNCGGSTNLIRKNVINNCAFEWLRKHTL